VVILSYVGIQSIAGVKNDSWAKVLGVGGPLIVRLAEGHDELNKDSRASRHRNRQHCHTAHHIVCAVTSHNSYFSPTPNYCSPLRTEMWWEQEHLYSASPPTGRPRNRGWFPAGAKNRTLTINTTRKRVLHKSEHDLAYQRHSLECNKFT
jgi:hypothetical protein